MLGALTVKILITGGTGFIGKPLCEYLQAKGYFLTVFTRNLQKAHQRLPYQAIQLITDLSAIDLKEKFDAVINLAGEPILQRWTKRAKKELIESRKSLTEKLITYFKKMENPPRVLLSGSAIGYYGPHHDERLNEEGAPAASFSHTLCQTWENAAISAKDLGIRVCYLRTGIVLGQNGGALSRMKFPFKLGLGGKIGTGLQWMSWVHLEDMIRLIEFCIQNSQMEGPVNATAPHPLTNLAFTRALGKELHRPTFMTMPEFMIKFIFGQMGEELLLQGQRVIPAKLLQNGFTFSYPDLESALNNLLH